MKYLILFLLLLTGCATVGKKQSECESQYDKFQDVVSCTKDKFADDPRAKNSAAFKLYMLKGQQLSQMIDQGKVSDIDARVEWQELYMLLKGKEGAAAQQAFNNWNATRVKTTNCISTGSTVQCNSY